MGPRRSAQPRTSRLGILRRVPNRPILRRLGRGRIIGSMNLVQEALLITRRQVLLTPCATRAETAPRTGPDGAPLVGDGGSERDVLRDVPVHGLDVAAPTYFVERSRR